MVETGFTRAKNAVNIIMKNLMDFSMGAIGYWAVGFGLMFGATTTGFFGTEGFFLSNWDMQDNWTLAFWIFQTVFCATAATIVSGAMAERTNLKAYLLFSLVMTTIIYPIAGSWYWGSLFHGEGWIEAFGFIDFAGSTVVHSVGGWAALAGAIVVGPRIGKYAKDGSVRAIPGHNIPLATIGVFILWFGWYGFNVGSETAADTALPLIAVNTTLAPAAGVLVALFTTVILYKKFDAGMSLNGALAGLVGITAGCANVTPAFAVLIGAIAGFLVVFSVIFFDKIRVDDPVGAISVHGVCGVWGTLAAGLFNYDFEAGGLSPVILPQIIGIVAAFVWAFGVSFIAFKIINIFIKIRVSETEELEGLDKHEHGVDAYPEYAKSLIK
ncbi:MAG: ammonium transporter [Geovibrio sp.]|nr:ammonium transporter [Geovibrio sp.]